MDWKLKIKVDHVKTTCMLDKVEKKNMDSNPKLTDISQHIAKIFTKNINGKMFFLC